MSRYGLAPSDGGGGGVSRYGLAPSDGGGVGGWDGSIR